MRRQQEVEGTQRSSLLCTDWQELARVKGGICKRLEINCAFSTKTEIQKLDQGSYETVSKWKVDSFMADSEKQGQEECLPCFLPHIKMRDW